MTFCLLHNLLYTIVISIYLHSTCYRNILAPSTLIMLSIEVL
jgi:hypothetical protein